MKYQPYVCDMEHEQYKQEAARLLKKIERRPLRKVKCMRWVAVCAVLLMVGIGVPYIQFGRSEKILSTGRLGSKHECLYYFKVSGAF